MKVLVNLLQASFVRETSPGDAGRRRSFFGLALLAVVCLGLVALASSSASAAFPGQNGKIAFVSNRDGGDNIFVMNPDGSNPTDLTNNSVSNLQPAFSADGTKIAFVSNRDGQGKEIYVMGSNGSNPTRLTNNSYVDDLYPAFSPDGTKIAFQSNRDGNHEIYVMDAKDADGDGNGDNPTNLTNNPADDDYPAFSPDGTKIAFTSYRGFDAEVYVMGSDGSNPTNLTNNGAYDDAPTFSPDGTKIAFVSSRNGGQNDIYVMPSSGSNNPTNLTSTTSTNEGTPAFSPDGTKIAFERDFEIYVMGSDGSNPTNLTNSRFSDYSPDWGVAVSTPSNKPPVATNDSYSVNQDQTLNVPAPGVLANDSDPENDSLTAIKVLDPASGTLTLNSDGSFTYTPTSGFSGTDSFTYKANDGTTDSNVATVTITVKHVNSPPVANDDSANTFEGTPVNIPVLNNDTDPDSDTLTVASNTNPTHGSVNCTNTSCTYTPASNYIGPDSFTYTVSDGNGGTDTATVTITVVAVNKVPIANNDAYNVDEGQPLSVSAPGVLQNDVDADGDSLKAKKVSDPSHGALALNTDGSFTYTPTSGFSGTDSFTYKANDGTNDSNVATVQVTVKPAGIQPPPPGKHKKHHHKKKHEKHHR